MADFQLIGKTLYCSACERANYVTTRDDIGYGEVVHARDFKAVDENYCDPIDGQKARCLYCEANIDRFMIGESK